MNGLTAIAAGILAGAVLTPVLLPWLPGRAFTLKGLAIGLITALIVLVAMSRASANPQNFFQLGGWLFIISAISAYLAMNFTGASTYTSLSGVRSEMRWAVPLQICAIIAGITFLIASRFFA
jgi:acetyl-CoA decarbonylase/synthase complex subunit gamma